VLGSSESHVRDVAQRDRGHRAQGERGRLFIEVVNPRHAARWQVWQDLKLPDGKILIPGVLDSTTNFVEHPELVADRIETFAKLVGRENVIAGQIAASAQAQPRPTSTRRLCGPS
jgi:methionine synthase II (cobalamin-independent)